jgi:hypothetical protein
MSPERYQQLLAAERNFTDILPDLDNLEQCGEDCTAEREIIKSRIEQIAKLKQHFKPQGY